MRKDRAPQDNFINLDVKKLEQIEIERKKLLASAMQKMPDIHFMRCPRCSSKLFEESINEIIIFICAQCEGLWLDASSCARILSLDFEEPGEEAKAKKE
jgi:hypothetical protein